MSIPEPQNTLVILDSNAIIHRAFHALPPLTDKNGLQTNAVYGYFSVLFKVFQELNPKYLVATFDMAGPTFRHKQFEGYKATRVKAAQELYDQIPVVKEGLQAMGIPILEQKEAEADDVMGTLANMAAKYGLIQKVILVTGDMDAMQLVDKITNVFVLKKGISDTAIFDPQAVVAKYGFTPRQVVDFKGLKGDTSDNIPGVPGIGDKTALKLIDKFGDLETLYQYVDKVEDFSQISSDMKEVFGKKMFENLKNFKEQAFFSKELATIKIDLELKIDWEDTLVTEFEKNKVYEFFAKYQFESLKNRFDRIFVKDIEPKPIMPVVSGKNTGSLFDVTPRVAKKSLNESEAESQFDWQGFIKTYHQPIEFEKVCFVVEYEDRWFLVNDKNEMEYVGQISALVKRIGQIKVLKVGYDLKKLLVDLDTRKVNKDWWDIKIAEYLLSPGEKNYDWSKIQQKYLRYAVLQELGALPWVGIVEIYQKLNQSLTEKNLEYVFYEIEMKLMPVLGQMEKIGMYVDNKHLEKLSKEMATHIDQLQTQIFAITKTTFNLNSPKQLGEILFSEQGVLSGINKLKKTKGGQVSTSAEVLESLRDKHPVVSLILQYRELTKLKNTYVDVLPTLTDQIGRLHTTFEQTGTATGRLSSNNPNLQNIPGHSEWGKKVKESFVAVKDKMLVTCDYSQIELRLAAHLSEDANLLHIFQSGEDIHRATAANMFGVALDQVSTEMRYSAKAINFGILYGMGSVSLARNLNITKKEADEYLKKYKATYPKLMEFLEELKEQARTTKEARTLFGRLRDLREFSLKDPRAKSALERIAMNMPLQGLQADIVKLAMIRVFDELCDQKTVALVMQVHDELVLEVDQDKAESVAAQVKVIMEGVFRAKIPLPVEVCVSSKWEK
jgi:DNA polymerase-1